MRRQSLKSNAHGRAFLLAAGLSILLTCRTADAQSDPLVCESQGFPSFCFMTTANISLIVFGQSSWGDLDGDGDMDLIQSGARGDRDEPNPVLAVYENQGDFAIPGPPTSPDGEPSLDYNTRYAQAAIQGAGGLGYWDGGTTLGDYDGDGDLDLAVTGRDRDGGFTTTILRNDSSTDITLSFAEQFDGLAMSSIAWGDADNDGDLDLALSGVDTQGASSLWIAENVWPASPAFVLHDTGLAGGALGQLVWGDDDNDGDLDLLVSGIVDGRDGMTRVYRNTGATFVDASAGLTGPLYSSADWGDFDGDGDLDVLVGGGQISPFVLRGVSRVYRNDGGAYTETAVTSGAFHGSAAWVDVDTDGDLDVLVSGGLQVSGGVMALFLEYDGASFSITERLGGGLFGHAALADYDGDGDVDVLLTGTIIESIAPIAQEYRNEIPHSNQPPSAPAVLAATPAPASVTLTWTAGSDDQTPTESLTYNLRVGTAPGANDVVPSNAAADGRRLLTARGNVDHNLAWSLRDLGAGTYYWAVQAIDASGVGSPFSPEATFVIP